MASSFASAINHINVDVQRVFGWPLFFLFEIIIICAGEYSCVLLLFPFVCVKL